MRKDKIGIVTYFKSYNYGVWLQAYATQRFLDINGYKSEIINYSNHYEKQKLKYSYKEGNKSIGYITSFLKSVLYGKVRYYNRGFRKHLKECYTLSDKEYNSTDALRNVDYDILIVGSDQVWNPKITNGLDKVFLLQFGHPHKRLSISSSLGSVELSQRDKKELVDALKSFDAISVREQFAKDFLKNDLNNDIKVLPDPTFLLTKEQWISSMVKKSAYWDKKEKYILTYFVSNEKRKAENIELIKCYSATLGIPVYAIQFSTFFSDGVSKKIVGSSIFDFLALLFNAELMITDSFHGIALSINLNKNFIAIVNSENPIRVQNLLNYLKLTDRIGMQPNDYQEIDYKSVNRIIDDFRTEAQEWIIGHLNA